MAIFFSGLPRVHRWGKCSNPCYSGLLSWGRCCSIGESINGLNAQRLPSRFVDSGDIDESPASSSRTPSGNKLFALLCPAAACDHSPDFQAQQLWRHFARASLHFQGVRREPGLVSGCLPQKRRRPPLVRSVAVVHPGTEASVALQSVRTALTPHLGLKLLAIRLGASSTMPRGPYSPSSPSAGGGS